MKYGFPIEAFGNDDFFVTLNEVKSLLFVMPAYEPVSRMMGKSN